MKTKLFFALMAAAALTVACDPKPVGPEYVPTFEVSGASINDGKLEFAAAGANVSVAVKSNLSWTVTSSESWLTVTPASFEGNGEEPVETQVTVAVSANTAYEPRTATLTIAAADFPEVVLSVSQAAASKPELVFDVLGSDMTSALTSVSVAAAAEDAYAYVISNVSFTVASDAAWCTVSPASVTIADYEETPSTVTLSVAENASTDPRTATVTLTPAEGSPVTLSVSQEGKIVYTIAITASGVTATTFIANFKCSDASVYFLPSCETTWFEQYTDLTELAQADLDYWKSKYGNTYANYNFDSYEDLFFNALAVQDEYEWDMEDECDPETTYHAYAFVVNEDYTVGSDVFFKDVTTDKMGDMAPEYSKWLGDYTFVISGKTHKATISAKVVNSTFVVDLSGEGNSYIEDFSPIATWDKATDKLLISQQTMGQWTHSTYGTVTDMVLGVISYNGGYPSITGNGYPIASLSYDSGNVVIESAGAIEIQNLGSMDLVGMSLFGSTSAGSLRYVDVEDYMLFPVTLTAAGAPSSVKTVAKNAKSFCGTKNAYKVPYSIVLR